MKTDIEVQDAQTSMKAALPVWIRIGLLSFGGPAGQIALMQEEVVNRRGWISSESFGRGLAFSMMLPGPEAQQLATWLGWRLNGLAGGLAAGLAFILPGAALMTILAWVAAAYGEVGLIAALFAGVQPFVIVLVIAALVRIGQRSIAGPWHLSVAIAAFLALWVFGAPFPVVIALAALIGLVLPAEEAADAPVEAGGGLWRHASRVVIAFAGLIVLVWLMVRLLGGSDPFDGVAFLFTTAAFVSFGGAYALLPYVAQQAVEAYGWLSPAAMLNGLAIAEATPGPLILVNTYAGFFAGWSAESTFTAGAVTALLATFYTFAPSFMLILAFAPVVERIQSVRWARRALAGVSAAVVGVIANLALFLAEASFFPSGFSSPEWVKLALFAAAVPLVFWARLGMMTLIGAGLVAGAALHLLGWL